MGVHAGGRTTGRLLTAAMSVLVFVGAGALATATAPARADNLTDAAQFLADTNRERTALGVAPLAANRALTGVAQRWSEQMVATTHLSHNPELFDDIDRDVTTNWRKVGENVGTGGDVESIEAAFMHSPDHRSHIVDPAFAEVGVAVSHGANGVLWVTLDFLQRAPARQLSAAGIPATQGAGSLLAASATATARTATINVVQNPALPPDSQLLMAPSEMSAPVQPSAFDLLAAMDDEPPAAPQPALFAPRVRPHALPLTGLIEIGDVALIGLVGGFGIRTRRLLAR